MMKVWTTAIKPALLDYRGEALALSTPNGTDPENFFYQVCTDPVHGFKFFHAPTHTNPYLPLDELAKLEKENHPLVFKQEYLAEFVDWSGVQFFDVKDLLVDEQPVPVPLRLDYVFATLDAAGKANKDNDGTAVVIWGVSKHAGHPLVILDWDIIQIEGALLETWLPTVFQNLEYYAKLCGARMGSAGVQIEDKSAGMILIQQALRNNWPARAIHSKLTSVGKDERALSVSGYVYQKKVKVTEPAFHKTKTYKNATRNHLLDQVARFRIKVENYDDDLLDCFCYGVAIALGNAGGF